MALLGVLGGTYDPPHFGHLAAAEEARHRLGLRRVLWVPAGSPPHKAKQGVTPAHHRVAMLRLAVSGNPVFEVSEIEQQRAGPSYTVDTLALLRAEHPAHELVFLLGSDEFAVLRTWREAHVLPELARLGVMVRAGVRLDAERVEEELPSVRSRYELVPVPDLPISSAGLRARIRSGLPIRYLVPDAVREYIEREGLYGHGGG